MIDNPIIRKEVLMTLRTGKALAMQVGFMLAGAMLVWLLWPADGLQDLGGRQANRILGVLAVGELALIILFAPAFTAASLTLERERNTFESLYATALEPWEIVTGKMAGALTFLLLLVLSALPALCLPLLLDGVTVGQVLAVLAVLLLTAVYLGTIGLLVSSRMRRSYRAIIVTYALLLVLCFLPAIGAWPLTGHLILRAGPVGQVVLHVVASFSPVQAMISLVLGGQFDRGAAGMPPFWALYLFIAPVLTALAAWACFRRLRNPIAPPRPREGLQVVERGKITARTFLFLIDPRRRRAMIQWWQNPVLCKEFRSRPMLQAQWLLRAVSLCLIVSLLLVLLAVFGVSVFLQGSLGLGGWFVAPIAVLMMAVVLLVGPALAAGAICSDRETGVWDLLRTTRLSGWTIVSGKFQATLVPMLLLTAAMVPALLVLLWFNADLWPNIRRVLYVVGATVLFVQTAGVFFSALLSRTAAAAACAYGLVAATALLSLPVLLAQDVFSQSMVRALFTVNPLAAVMDAAGNRGMQRLGVFEPYLWFAGIATVVLLGATIVRVHRLLRSDRRA